MEFKTIPNIFISIYRLARQDNYDISKWRDMLTGIHRKSKEKHNIKDICLLYYSLFKGYTNKELSRMVITYIDRNTRENLGPITIRDIADLYIDRVSDLMKYMNTKQLAMISKFLLMMNRLNEPLCNIILSKISNNNIKITNRSFFNIILSLSESNYVNSDTIEKLLIQNKDILYNMNKVDIMYLIKSISINNIKNEFILNIITDKLEYYSKDMKSDELLSTLYTFYRLNWYNELIIRNLFFRIQNLLDKYNISSLVLISKYLSHFNLKDIKDFYDLQLIPLIHERVENQLNMNNIIDKNNSDINRKEKINKEVKTYKDKLISIIEKEKEKSRDKDTTKTRLKTDKVFNTDEILLLYKYCLKSGSTSFPKLIDNYLEELREYYQWDLLFSILYKYQINTNYNSSYMNKLINYYRNIEINEYLKYEKDGKDGNNFNSYLSNNDYNNNDTSSCYLNGSEDYLGLVLKATDLFKKFIKKNEFNQKYLSSIVKYIIQSEIDNEELILEILEKLDKLDIYSSDDLVDIMFNLHTFDSEMVNDYYDRIIKRFFEDNKKLDDNKSLYISHFIPILCILFYRNIEIPLELVGIFKSIFVINELQDMPWQVKSLEGNKIIKSTSTDNNNNDKNIIKNSGDNNNDMNANSSNTGNNNKTNSYSYSNNNDTNNYSHIYDNIKIYKRHMLNISDDILEYLLYTIVFPNQGGLIINKYKFIDFKTEICTIFKMIKKYRNDNLLNSLLYYIGKIDKSLAKCLIDIKNINYTELNIDIMLNIQSIPYPLSYKYKHMGCILIKIDDNIIFNPCYLVPGTNDVYYFDSCIEKWDSISRNILRAILHQNNYNTHKI